MSVQGAPVTATGGIARRDAGDAPAGDRRARWWRRLTPWLFLAPFLTLFLIFVVLPLLWALNLSAFRTRLVGGRTFVGIDNYVRVLQDSTLWDGVRNVLSFGLFQVPVMLGLALVAALILDGGLVRRQTIYRLLLFLPFAVPGVVAALIWGYLYGQAFGPVAQVARAIGTQPPQFLTQATILPLLANISTWQYLGYNMLILFAALKAVPSELYEAARVDGASDVQIAWRIKIPLILPAIVLATIFSIIGTLQLFTEPRLLRPTATSVIGPAFTPNLYVESLAFQNRQFDYAAAVSFTIAAVTAVLSAIVLILVHRRSRL